ncbi:Uncharacterised protein [Streptococcus pyogenes]|uniref:hypothetical protein n=1 Tax=Streptococcus pyogenes TaxID=1314 RepID=UPI0010DA9864|nr:hypothetical protein [Streptococcus pyogenes]VGQ92839.1 hypothetical membrane associated protein [Streptococcus pyogenes]VGV45416.1 Uncharacterised protein [Streptococcus pyogenes]VGW11477.1 Uncharacterised protein [Streptococcus pyogenes]VGW20040.1 Uncharacterised protein [Streptococcus pyogenes]VHA80374.1 Uncharacterised protein [Streptococcus pyogenes]
MKTKKSKRFLNLATLCLALLGTALLMGQPVKVVTADTSAISDNGEAEGSEKYWWYQGYKEGYKKGEKSETKEELNRRTFNQFPQGIPDSDHVNKGEYMDGYETGYSAGWYSTHGNGGTRQEDSDSDTKNRNSQEGEESDNSSQGDRGRQDSVDSSSQQEETDMISPVIQAVLQTVFGVFSSFLNWLEATI